MQDGGHASFQKPLKNHPVVRAKITQVPDPGRWYRCASLDPGWERVASYMTQRLFTRTSLLPLLNLSTLQRGGSERRPILWWKISVYRGGQRCPGPAGVPEGTQVKPRDDLAPPPLCQTASLTRSENKGSSATKITVYQVWLSKE